MLNFWRDKELIYYYYFFKVATAGQGGWPATLLLVEVAMVSGISRTIFFYQVWLRIYLSF